MNFVIFLLFALKAINCEPITTPAYSPVYGYGYGVPVAQQPIVYAHPYHSHIGTPVVGAYAVHTTPAYSHVTQTHPVSVRPIAAYGIASAPYYAPQPAVVEQTRLVVPQSPRIYRYQGQSQQYAYPQQNRPVQFNGGEGGAYYGQNNQGYANRMPYTNNGEQVKTRRYQIFRPAIHKQFYDVEEKMIVRPVGSAIIELDPPFKKQALKNDVTPYQQPYGRNYADSGRYNGQGFTPRNGQNQQYYNPQGGRENQYFGQQGARENQYFAQPDQYRFRDCDFFVTSQTPVFEYGPPTVSPPNRFHPTTFAPPTTTTGSYPTTTTGQYPTTTGQYPTTTGQYPTTTTGQYQPTDQTYSTTGSEDYPTTTYGSTPGQFTPTYSTTAGTTTQQPQQSDIFISTTTPVAVTVVDNSNVVNQTQKPQDIIYANQRINNNNNNNNNQQFGDNENSPDQFRNELPPRGDIAQYQNDPSDQFYHELPNSRYTNGPDRRPQASNVYTKSRGDPTETPSYYGRDAEVISIGPQSNQRRNNGTGNGQGNKEQQRLIQLYTGGDGISEVARVEEVQEFDEPSAGGQYQQNQSGRYQNGQYQNDRNGRYQNGQYQQDQSGQYQSGQYQEDQSGRYQSGQYQEDQSGRYQQDARGQYQPDRSGEYRNEPKSGQYQSDQYRNEQSNGQYRNEPSQFQSDQYRNEQSNGQYRNEPNQFQSGQYRNEPNQFQSGQYRNEQSNGQYRENANGQNQNTPVRARVISVTPAPSTAPEETTNKRRLVVSTPITTIQEVEEVDNSTTNGKPGQYRANYENQRDSNQNNNFNNEFNSDSDRSDEVFQNNGYNGNYRAQYNADPNVVNYDHNERFTDDNNNGNSNYDRQYNGGGGNGGASKTANYANDDKKTQTNGLYISTTPPTASQRIIYVQPVSQDFAKQKAVAPKNQ